MPITSTFGAMAARGFGLFSAIKQAIDEYFEYVTLLLPGNGTNGAQNNTFLDSSTNNFTITRNGNTTQGTFAPYGSNWSNYFDNTGDYLTTNGSAFSVSSSQTIEFWTYCTFLDNEGFVGYSTTSSPGDFYVQWNANLIYLKYGTASASSFSCPSATLLNVWVHHAVVRNGSTVTYYLNGVSKLSITVSANPASQSYFVIGDGAVGVIPMQGYISNVRIVQSAVYTADFTPPTAPLTAIANTSLLTCQSNRFLDNSTNNFTITKNGDVSVQVFSPFNPTASYAAGTIGGSGYFDGTGDYLTTPLSLSGASNFTAEGWFYCRGANGANGSQIIFGQAASNPFGYYLYLSNTFSLSFFAKDSAGTNFSAAGITVNLNTFVHFAVVKSGTNINLFINGVLTGTITGFVNNFNGSANISIGALSDGAFQFNGYISNFRVVSGVVLYTGNFTPPTSPLTAISNTSLLLNFTNAGVIDNAMMNDLETVGNAQISTTQSKWGGSSIAFDGTGDWLLAPSSTNFQLLTANFTIEMWVYFNNTSGYALCDLRGVGTASVNNPAIFWSISPNTSKVAAYLDNSERIVSGTLSTGQWYHVALVRSGTTANLYIDGTSAGTYTYSTSIAQQALYVGTGSGLTSFNGYIDDFRITKGYARYTANFTPPAGPFPTR